MKYRFLSVALMCLCLAVLCGLFGVGCGPSESEKGSTGVTLQIKSDAPVPDDCRQWLLTFCDAFNKQDGARIMELTASKDVAGYLANAPESARQTMADSAVKNVQRISQGLGTIKSCTVESCRETTFAKDAQPPGPMGAGKYFDIQGKARCSKREATVSFLLYKQADNSDPIIGLWNFRWSPL